MSEAVSSETRRGDFLQLWAALENHSFDTFSCQIGRLINGNLVAQSINILGPVSQNGRLFIKTSGHSGVGSLPTDLQPEFLFRERDRVGLSYLTIAAGLTAERKGQI